MNVIVLALILVILILTWVWYITSEENKKLKAIITQTTEEKKHQLIVDMRGWRAIRFVGENDDAPNFEYRYQIPQSLNIHESKDGWSGPLVIKSTYQISRETSPITLGRYSPSVKK